MFDHYAQPSDAPHVERTGTTILHVSGAPDVASGCLLREHQQGRGSIKKDPLHPAHCDICDSAIRGIRFKCLDCPDYDMCSNCILNNRSKHELEHEFIALHDPMRHIVVHLVHDDDDETVQADINDSLLEEPRHSAFCDMCKKDINGIRWKCIDCPGACQNMLSRSRMLSNDGIAYTDYDLCATCWATDRTKHRDGRHKFVRIVKPGEIFVHRVREGPSTPRAMTEAPPIPVAIPPASVPHANQAEVVHNATCDLCDSRILGVRYKCTRCPDYDVCSSCFL
jgi:hypothetical protein